MLVKIQNLFLLCSKSGESYATKNPILTDIYFARIFAQ